ncbi:MAG: UDP-glucose 4-epimerase GalE [Actinobacteria bacterium]|nr:UDP-glucose 4-epimerase GalE [Actinomycetota bacterium]
MKVLITGGAGYIGSVTARRLADSGYDVLIVDNLSLGHRESTGTLKFECVDLDDRKTVSRVCGDYKPDAAIHFAARSLVGESMTDPLSYLGGNVAASLNLFRSLVENGCRNIVFSSSAAVYGIPGSVPIDENAPVRPINPYGSSKWICEQLLGQFSSSGLLNFVSLRYFNAAGADIGNDLGEDHEPETHLIPRVVLAALGKYPSVKIFGTDYPTGDGTCVRDYIHVNDLAGAHIAALDYLLERGGSTILNLGNGDGFSVREIISLVKEVSGVSFSVSEEDKRPGDPPVLIASNSRAEFEIGWKPQLGIREIVRSAWEWHSMHPDGYSG